MRHSYHYKWGTTIEKLTLTIRTPHNWIYKALLYTCSLFGIDLWSNTAITKTEIFKDAEVVHLEIGEDGIISDWVGKKEGE